MVKRYWKYAAGSLLVLVLGLTVGAAWWLLATVGGARWLVRKAPAALTVQKVEGRLCDHLRLTGVRASGADGALAIEQLQIVWQPMALLRGKLLVTELTTDGLSFIGGQTSPRPKADKPPEAWRWPELPVWLQWLQVDIKKLRLQRLTWQGPDQSPLTLDQLAGRVKWTGSCLEVSDFSVLAEDGELSATLIARWRQPLLRLKVNARLKDVAGEPAGLDLALEMQPVNDGEGFAGEVSLSARSAPGGEWDLASQLELNSREAVLQDLELRPVGAKGRVSGALRLGWAAEPLTVAANLVVAELDLAPFTGQATDLAGTLQLFGSIDDYRGQFSRAN